MHRSNKAVASIIDPYNPVVSRLGRVFGGFLPGRSRAVPGLAEGERPSTIDRYGLAARIDVVDEKLCDDVIEYLAPSLEPYKHCTIIDVNPGACLWSRKLHDYLKPNQHLLMEPEERYYDAFIKPLLDRPGSTFKYTSVSGTDPQRHSANYDQLFDGDQLLPLRPKLPHNDPRLRQIDTSLLVTGSLARRHTDPIFGLKGLPIDSVSAQSMTWAALINDLFHRGGLVRMLWWLPDLHKAQALPRSITNLSMLHAMTQIGASITEIAGVNPDSALRLTTALRSTTDVRSERRLLGRHGIHQTKVRQLVMGRMDKAGLRIPAGATIQQITGPETSSHPNKVVNPVAIQYNNIEDLENAVNVCKDRVDKVFDAVSNVSHAQKFGPSRLTALNPLMDTIMYSQSYRLMSDRVDVIRYGGRKRAKSLDLGTASDPEPGGLDEAELAESQAFEPKRSANLELAGSAGSKPTNSNPRAPEASFTLRKAVVLYDAQLRIVNLEAHCAHFEERGEDVRALKARVLALDKHFLRVMRSQFALVHARILEPTLADTLAIAASPALLSYDRRTLEPLQANRKDFWPRGDLALLDFVPSSRDLAVPGLADHVEGARTAQELIRYLYHYKAQTLPWVLDKVAPNAAQDLIPKVSVLMDPRKGGRLNVDALQVRSLTDEMIEGLTKAWLEWPFRPERHDLALQTSDDVELEEGVEAEAWNHVSEPHENLD